MQFHVYILDMQFHGVDGSIKNHDVGYSECRPRAHERIECVSGRRVHVVERNPRAHSGLLLLGLHDDTDRRRLAGGADWRQARVRLVYVWVLRLHSAHAARRAHRLPLPVGAPVSGWCGAGGSIPQPFSDTVTLS